MPEGIDLYDAVETIKADKEGFKKAFKEEVGFSMDVVTRGLTKKQKEQYIEEMNRSMDEIHDFIVNRMQDVLDRMAEDK